MPDSTQARFDQGALAWTAYNQEPLGHIRREVTWRCLAPHLPPVTDRLLPPRVLDLGGGSGELALRLAELGYRTWLVDYALAMLDQARLAAQELPAEARARLELCAMPADEVPQAFAPGTFDAILCHTLIEYLPDPPATLAKLAPLLRERGLLSLSFVNRHAEVLRQVWSRQDLVGARVTLETGAFEAKLFGVSGTAYTTEEVAGWVAGLDLAVTATYGIRIFADYLPRTRLADPEFFADLLRLEADMAGQAPYLSLARYVHLLARQGDATD
jgi:S-adenosylmethionine-dependent methyltransferase